MSVIAYPPVNPAYADGTPVPGPCAITAFRTALNSYVAGAEAMAQATQGAVENLHLRGFHGGLTGGTISAGAGLSVSVAALTAFCGQLVGTNAATTVGGLTDNATSYIWLRQDGTFTVTATDVSPSTADHGIALRWGTATAAGGAVTAVSNARNWWSRDGLIDTVTVGDSISVPIGRQMLTYETSTISGTETVYGVEAVMGLASTVYWDDLRVSGSTLAGAGIHDPGWAKVGDNGAGSQGVYARAFDNGTEEELGFEVQLPHGYKPGTDICAHVHWQPTAAGTVGQVVCWGLEYRWADIGRPYGNTTIIHSNAHYPAHPILADDTHYLTDLGAITGSGHSLSSCLQCRLFRDAAGALATDSYGADAALIYVDFHYQIEQPGSRAEYTY